MVQNEQVSVKVEVPASLPQAFKTSVTREMRKVKVNVDQRGEPKEAQVVHPSTARIDDPAADEFAWRVQRIGEGVGKVTWTLRGKEDEVEAAKKVLQAKIDELTTNGAKAYLAVPNEKHRLVIGAGGSTINRLRRETDCEIEVPRGRGDDVITIVGTLANVERARKAIIEMVL
jgi:hypothetical protein